jgi:hypothetical protein
MLQLTKNALAVTALASAGVLFFQQPGVAGEATPKAFGVSVNALGLTLAETPVSTVAHPHATLATSAVGSVLTSDTLTTSASVAPDTGTETATARVERAKLSALATGVSADAVQVRCTAVPGQTPTGSFTAVNGTTTPGLLGSPTTIRSSAAPNTTIKVGLLATLVVNEQTVSDDGGLTVNGLHLRVLGSGGGDVIVASATCGSAGTGTGALAVAAVPMISAQGALAAGGLVMLGFAGARGWRMARRRADLSV